MTLDQIKRIGVVGAGTMGSGVAQIAAMAGYDVVIFDLSQEIIKKAETIIGKNLDKGIERGKLTREQKTHTLAKLTFTDKLEDLKADVIIEAIVEKLEVKQELFGKLAELNGAGTILASNTSSIPITQIAETIPNPGRVVGMHFFNPAHIMKLVEVISAEKTDPAIAETVRELSVKFGKSPVMARDKAGFIVNRVGRSFYIESLRLLEEESCDVETLDSLIESCGFKMGPLRLMDLIGHDSNYLVSSFIYEAFDQHPRFKPSYVQKELVDAGNFGKKTGKGFYEYD